MLSLEISDIWSLIAVTLIESILSGIDENPPGEYMLTQMHHNAKRMKYIARRSFCFFLNLGFWTIKKLMIHKIHTTTMILIINHEKSPNDGLMNCLMSRIDILLWKKYIVKISSTNSKNIPEIMMLFMIFINVFLTKALIVTNPKITRHTTKSLIKYQR